MKIFKYVTNQRSLRMIKNKSIFDILTWIALAWILIWLALKVMGILKTPLLLEWSPAFAAVYIVGRAMQKLVTVENIAKQIGKDVRRLDKDFRSLEFEHNLITKKVLKT